MNSRTDRRRRTALACSAALALAATGLAAGARHAAAQGFPAQPLRLLVGFSAGGGADAIARTVAAGLGERLGQNVVVENRPGASSTIAADLLAKAPADGYTLMLGDSSLLIASQAMAKVSFDPLTSFAPIASVAIAPLALAVTADSPLRSLEDMAAAAKPGAPLLYATSGVGTVHHLAMAYLQSRAKVPLSHVPYRGASQIIPDLIAGRVALGVISAAAAIGQVKAGKIRVLGLTSPDKLPDTPEWRAIADWLPGFDASPRLFVLAPAGTPAPVRERLERETMAAVNAAAVREKLVRQGVIPTPRSAVALAADMRAELERWGALIRQANITLK